MCISNDKLSFIKIISMIWKVINSVPEGLGRIVAIGTFENISYIVSDLITKLYH